MTPSSDLVDPWEVLVRTLARRYPGADLKLVEHARSICSDWPVVARERALARAQILAELRLDPPALAASLVCLAPASHPGAAAKLGPEVEQITQGIERLHAIRWDALDQESAESLRRMFVAMAKDVRVVLVLLADRLLELRRAYREEEAATRRALARETMDVFAPLANRLGVWQLKWELEDLALRELEPNVYREIVSELAHTRVARDAFITSVVDRLTEVLAGEGLSQRVLYLRGRPKHIHSIYKKMERKQVPLAEIYDQLAVRIIVRTVADCYAVLGAVHGLWTPIAGEFDDYIARPKHNLYQSLHTAVVGPGGRAVEIQIRTQEMHDYAEYGVAAHWAYKEGQGSRGGSRHADRKFDLLRELMEWQKDLADPEALADALKTDLFEDQVHVFTPTGEVVALPKGATSLDFAYRIHTLVGHRCRGAKVDGQIVSLQTPLETGQRVEILTRKDPAPSRDWLSPHLGYLVTASAKHKVRQWFRQQDRDQALAQGQEQLERELSRLGVGTPDADALAKIAQRRSLRGEADLWIAVGFGDLGAHTIAAELFDLMRPPSSSEETTTPTPPVRGARKRRTTAAGVSVDGVDDVLSQPARCCGPVPGDEIVGYITRGRGVMIHRRDCSNIVHAQEPERLVDVDWGRDRTRRYPVTLVLEVHDARGVFGDIMGIISAMSLDIHEANTSGRRKDRTQTITLGTEIGASDQLVKLLARLAALPSVLSVHRRAD